MGAFIFKYGNYAHQPGEVTIAVTKRAVNSPRGLKSLIRQTFTVAGVLLSSDGTPATLTTQMNALGNAYGVNPNTGQVTGAADFQNAILYLGDGVTPTEHQMYSGNSLSGTRVTSFSWLNGNNAEYVSFRSYSLTIEADFADPTQNLLDFSETLAVEGDGGPRVIWIESLDGEPQPQLSSAATTMRATQSGSATGAFQYPNIPGPLYPDSELSPLRKLKIGPVKRVGQSLYEFPVSWSYSFEDVSLDKAFPATP
jgi:hypothetical protein